MKTASLLTQPCSMKVQMKYMSKNIIRRLMLVVTVVAALFLMGCGGDPQERARLNREAEDMVNEAYLAQDYQRIIEALKTDTDQFRDGAEQNDDLTMLAIRITD